MSTRAIRKAILLIRTYSELKKLKSFEERYFYLKLTGQVGKETFGFDRYLNQALYTCPRWRKVRDKIIVRDNGCDLGLEGFDIPDRIIVHHMNPVLLKDIEEENDDVFNPEFLISTSHDTHNAIHFGDDKKLKVLYFPRERHRGDTCLW